MSTTHIYHNHHIIPKHAGGTDDPSNLIRLTIPEHAEAHKKLWEENGKQEDLIAWKMLSGQITITEAKKQAQILGARKGGLISGPKKKIISEQGRLNTSIGQKGKIQTPETTKKVINFVARNWIFTNPSNISFEVFNKAEFCRLNNLTPNAMTSVSQGKQKQHKGRKCKKIIKVFEK